MLFAANLSILWPELPLADRFERAARAGFGAVELWWPGLAAARSLPALTARWGVRLVLLNFDAGNMAAGQRGLAGDPGRRERLRASVPQALAIAQACACPGSTCCSGCGRNATHSASSWPAPGTTSPGRPTWRPRPAAR